MRKIDGFEFFRHRDGHDGVTITKIAVAQAFVFGAEEEGHLIAPG